MNLKKKQIIIFIAIQLSLATSVRAADQWIGAWYWNPTWDVGVLKKDGNVSVSPAAVIGYFSSVTTVKLNMSGITYSYVSDKWSLNYNGAIGDSRFSYDQNLVGQVSGNFKYSPLPTDVYAKRSDNDLTFVRRIADSGFSAFVGLKAQDYFYSYTGNPGFGISTAGGLIKIGVTSSYKYYYSRSGGLSAGIGYTLPITGKLSLSAQLGGIYLKGSLFEDGFMVFNDPYVKYPNILVPSVTTSAYMRSHLRQSNYLQGGTVRLTVDYKMADKYVLRIGYQGQQATITNSKTNSAGMTVFGSWSSSPDFYYYNVPFNLMMMAMARGNTYDKTVDKFHGLTISFLVKF